MEGIIKVYIYIADFVTAYMEYLIFYIFLCAVLACSIRSRKSFWYIGIIPALASSILNFMGVQSQIHLIITHIILFACLEYLVHLALIQMFIVYVLIYGMVMIAEIVQVPFWNLTSAGAFRGAAPIVGMLIVLVFAGIGYRYFHLNKIHEIIIKRNLGILLIAVDSFLVLFAVVVYARLRTEKFFSNYLIIVGVMLILVIVNGSEIYRYFKQPEQLKRMKTYEEYLPIVEGLIEQVRIRQHDYHNKLQSIHALAYVYEDFESLKGALLETTEHDMLPDFEMNLLKLNMHLVSGFLFSKIRQADKEGKELHLDIEQYVIRTACTEYEVIEYLGILIDNAIEATNEGETIFAKIGSQDDKAVFEIKNPGPHLTPEFCKNIFKKGYSTKKDGEGCHGIGLYKLNRMVKEYDGKLILENVEVDQKEYISFELRI